MKAFEVPAIFKAIDKMSAPMRQMERASMSFSQRLHTIAVRGERTFRKINTWAEGTFNKIVNLRNAAGALIAAMAFKKMYDGIVAVARTGDEIAKTSKRIGISAEAYQELNFAAERSGVSQSAFTSSLEKLNKNVGDLQAGSGQLRSILLKTNPALASQLKNVTSNEEAFNLMVKAVKSAPNAIQKASLAQAAFGRSGMEMINLLNEGPAGIEALREELRKYNGVLSNEAAAKAEAFMDAQTNLNKALLGMKFLVGSELMPVVQSMTEKVTNWIVQNKDLIKSKVAEWAEKISSTITHVYENIDKWISRAKMIIGLLVVLKGISLIAHTAMLLMAGAQHAITAAQWLMNAAMTANPIGIIIAGIGVLIGLVVLAVSKWDQFGAAMTVFMGPLGMVISLIQSFRKHWDSVVAAFEGGGIIGALKRIGFVILDSILSPVQQLLEWIGKLPGMANITGAGIDVIEKLRVQADQWSAPSSGGKDRLRAKEAINPEAAKLEAQKQIIEKTQLHQFEVLLQNKTNQDATIKANRSDITPKTTNTYQFT